MSEQVYEKDVVKAAEWLGVDASDLTNYVLAWFFLRLNKQGEFALKPGDKGKLEAIVERLKPLIEPAIQKVKGEQLVQVQATFWLPQRLVRLIEKENYFSYGLNNKDEFYADAVRSLLSCITAEQPARARKKLHKQWRKMGNWSRGKYERGYMKTHGQLWMTDSWIKEERAEYPPRVMRNLAAQLELVKPPLEVIEAFARKYGEDEGVVTLLEDNGHPLSVEFHDEWVTGVGGDLWIDLTLGKYRLHLNEEYARLFHDFMTHDYCY